MKVAYLGPAGTHSEEALRASAPNDIEAVPYPTIYDAVMAVQDGAVDRAVVPIENALELQNNDGVLKVREVDLQPVIPGRLAAGG